MPISPQSLIIRPGMISMTLSDITNIGLLSLMNTNYKAALGVILIVAVFATSVVGNFGKVFAQNVTNQTMTNQTIVNQTAAQMTNQTTNQSASSNPQLTTSDVEDIRKTLENVKKDIADGKSIDALKAINQIDDKLLVAMSKNPPPMLEKSTNSKK
jgi:hypothetical protein